MRSTAWMVPLAAAALVGARPASGGNGAPEEARPAVAGMVDTLATLNLYLTPSDYGGCERATEIEWSPGGCEGLVSDSLHAGALVWVVLSRKGGFPQGVGALQFGLQYEGLGQRTGWRWTLCSGGSEIPHVGWPGPGSGAAMTWGGGCYKPRGENVVVGFFTLPFSVSGDLRLAPHPRVHTAAYADCDAKTADICVGNLGAVNLRNGGRPVCGNRCFSTPESVGPATDRTAPE